MNLDSSAIWIIVYTRVDNKEKRVKLSPKSNATIQLRFDALTCCMFANIVQANSSHVTFQAHFLQGTTVVRYSLLIIMNSCVHEQVFSFGMKA